ncbi:MAG: hypothetical protein ACM3QZ_00400 [Solirubrobacterales bacterium]
MKNLQRVKNGQTIWVATAVGILLLTIMLWLSWQGMTEASESGFSVVSAPSELRGKIFDVFTMPDSDQTGVVFMIFEDDYQEIAAHGSVLRTVPPFYRSTDSGRTWNLVLFPDADLGSVTDKIGIYLLGFLPDGKIYMKTYKERKTQNLVSADGIEWQNVDPKGLTPDRNPGASTGMARISLTTPQPVGQQWVQLKKETIAISADRGKTWSPQPFTGIRDAVYLDDQSLLLADNRGQVFRALLNGPVRTVNNVSISGAVLMLPIRERSGNMTFVLYDPQQPGAVWVSRDQGDNWMQMDKKWFIPAANYRPERPTQVVAARGGWIGVTTESGRFLISWDYGQHWAVGSIGTGTVVIMPVKDGAMLIANGVETRYYRFAKPQSEVKLDSSGTAAKPAAATAVSAKPKPLAKGKTLPAKTAKPKPKKTKK